MTTEAKGAKRLSSREFDLLHSAVVLRLEVEYCRGKATWGGDYLEPFRAHETLKGLVKSGLMESVLDGRYFRATPQAREYVCRYCFQGMVYAAVDSDEIVKCKVCNGKGLVRMPQSRKP